MEVSYSSAPIPDGKCSLCGKSFQKKEMTRHLKSCVEKAPKPVGKAASRPGRAFHLIVEGRYLPQYWMHLEVSASATLAELDYFLRRICLECCHHMSAFTIESKRYSISPLEGYDEEGMEIQLAEVLRPRMKFRHQYDFGTTTELTLEVVGEREGLGPSESVLILARNEPPAIACGSCGKPARRVCVQCVWEDIGWLREDCAPKHECGKEMLLPVVNSPRSGMCAYTGQRRRSGQALSSREEGNDSARK